MSDILDQIFAAVATLRPEAEREVKATWKSLPLLQKAKYAAGGVIICNKAQIGFARAIELALDHSKWGQLLEHIMRLPAAVKLDMLRYADDYAGACKPHYKGYNRLDEYWPDAVATQEAADFLKLQGFGNLAELARAALAFARASPGGRQPA